MSPDPHRAPIIRAELFDLVTPGLDPGSTLPSYARDNDRLSNGGYNEKILSDRGRLGGRVVNLSSPAIAGGPPELSSSELAQLQSRRYAVPAKSAFGGVLSTLQSLGYVDINADKDSRTVSAITDAKAKTIFNIFWGFGKKKWTQKASLLIEEDGAGSACVST